MHTTQFFGALLEPSLNPKSFIRKLPDPNPASKSDLFEKEVINVYLAFAAFYTSVSGFFNANEPITILQ